MRRDCWCDEPRPDILGPFGYAALDLHRATHDLGRNIAETLGIYKLVDWLVERIEDSQKAR